MEKQSSGARYQITERTLMRDALEADPKLSAVLVRLLSGGCSICGFDYDATVGEVAADNDIPVRRLLEALNEAD